MTSKRRAHLTLLLGEVLMLSLLGYAGHNFARIFALDSTQADQVIYSTAYPLLTICALYPCVHIVILFEAAKLPTRSKAGWVWLTRGMTALGGLSLLLGAYLHFAALAHLQRLGYQECEALGSSGRIVSKKVFVAPPPPAGCAR